MPPNCCLGQNPSYPAAHPHVRICAHPSRTMSVFRRLLLGSLLVLAFAARAIAAPTVTTLVPAAGASVSGLTQISVTFSENVTGVDADDLLLNNDPASTVSGSGAGPYVFTFTQPPPGTVNVTW